MGLPVVPTPGNVDRRPGNAPPGPVGVSSDGLPAAPGDNAVGTPVGDSVGPLGKVSGVGPPGGMTPPGETIVARCRRFEAGSLEMRRETACFTAPREIFPLREMPLLRVAVRPSSPSSKGRAPPIEICAADACG
jgi:hypothetical protein